MRRSRCWTSKRALATRARTTSSFAARCLRRRASGGWSRRKSRKPGARTRLSLKARPGVLGLGRRVLAPHLRRERQPEQNPVGLLGVLALRRHALSVPAVALAARSRNGRQELRFRVVPVLWR